MSPSQNPTEGSSFSALLAWARAGSLEALGKALEMCRAALYRRAQRISRPAPVRPKCSESDLVQDTFLEAQRGLSAFKGTTQEEFLTWLTGILNHNAADWLAQFQTAKRQASREVSLDDERTGPVVRRHLFSDSPSPDRALEEKEQGEAIQRAMQKLPPHYARVIRMHLLEHCTYSEIAAEFQCSVEAARKLHSRAMTELCMLIHKHH
ncbi:MAG TPA: sigma-70 family RNA polymerase sigma factor [Gemmataceae bacterium]|nr:sigma-70 family RNA polymerase sigma factor [Gemmataceae bacterium]